MKGLDDPGEMELGVLGCKGLDGELQDGVGYTWRDLKDPRMEGAGMGRNWSGLG